MSFFKSGADSDQPTSTAIVGSKCLSFGRKKKSGCLRLFVNGGVGSTMVVPTRTSMRSYSSQSIDPLLTH
jgi:hypothetical protein